MTRTTLDIDDPVLQEIKNRRLKDGRSLGKIVSQLLAEALSREKTPIEKTSFKWISQPMHARMDISDKEALYSALEEDNR